MKNLVLIVFSFLIILGSLIFNIYDANKKIDTFFGLDNQIDEIAQINRNFELFATNKIAYRNYDKVQGSIDKIEGIFANILDENIYPQLKDTKLRENTKELKVIILKNVELIEKLKSYNAIFNNSIRNIQFLKSKINHSKFDKIYNKALTLDYYDSSHTLENQIDDNDFKATNNIEKIFISHIKIIFQYYNKKRDIYHKITELKLTKKIEDLHITFEKYTQNIISEIKITIYIFILLLIIAISLFIYFAYSVLKNKIELDKFKNALDISDNIIVITDKEHKIRYVNHGFEKSTGYSKKEVMGLKPSILRSGLLDEEFYTKLNETIHAGNIWYGEFINKNKYGKITHEKASITPIKDDHGEIIEYIAIKLDITKEKEYQNVLTHQSKMVSMGELLENIAHQWRQPLSIVSSISSGMMLELEYSEPTKKDIYKSYERIIDTTQKLSNTIDDLRNFFNKDEELVTFKTENTINKTLNLLNSKFDYHCVSIKVDNNDNALLSGKESEFIQAILNILNNSLDAFISKDIKNKVITISTNIIDEDYLQIKIADNAGGIEKDTLAKIFELYFTTKHQSQGTGVGLYMVYQIITKSFNGEVYAQNSTMTIDNIDYSGTTFIIKLPLKTNVQ